MRDVCKNYFELRVRKKFNGFKGNIVIDIISAYGIFGQ